MKNSAIFLALLMSLPIACQAQQATKLPPTARYQLMDTGTQAKSFNHYLVLLDTFTGAVYKSSSCPGDDRLKNFSPPEGTPAGTYETAFWRLDQCWIKMELPKQ